MSGMCKQTLRAAAHLAGDRPPHTFSHLSSCAFIGMVDRLIHSAGAPCDMMCTYACRLIFSDGDMVLEEDRPEDQPLDHSVVGPLAYPLPVSRTSHQDVFMPRILYQDVLNQV